MLSRFAAHRLAIYSIFILKNVPQFSNDPTLICCQIPILNPNGSAVLNELGNPTTNINYNVTWLRRDPDYINYYNNW